MLSDSPEDEEVDEVVAVATKLDVDARVFETEIGVDDLDELDEWLVVLVRVKVD